MVDDVDITNYMAVSILEQMDIEQPSQKQIDMMESILLNVVLVKQIVFHKVLNQVERNCLYWTAKGKTLKEIASIMKTTESTITFHTQSIMEKLTARTMEQAVFNGLRFGLLPEQPATE